MVAAEDFWGSIAEQLGGEKVEVTDIITNPAADPHDYEPTSEDAQTLAGAQMAIVNGIGYDEWASKLLPASPERAATELTVGDVLGLKDGDNPHQWYSPISVHKVIDAIVADYKEADRQRLLLRRTAGSLRNRRLGRIQQIDLADQGELRERRSAPRRASSNRWRPRSGLS